MELDDLRQAVAQLDRRAVRSQTLNLSAYRERGLDRFRASLRPLVWEHAGQVALGLLISFLVGPFWWGYWEQPSLFAAGALLHVYAVLMIALGTRVLVMLHTIDLASPVVEIQKQVARLRRSYVTTALVIGLPWWLLWMPLVMVIMGYDVVAAVSPAWLIANVAGGVIGMLVTLWWYRALWNRSSDPGRAEQLEAAAAGNSVRDAQRLLDEIARFEKE